MDAMSRLSEWQTKIEMWKTASVDNVKAGCAQFCENKKDLLSDKYEACKTLCASVDGAGTAAKQLVTFIGTTFRARLDELREKFPDQVAKVEAAAAALRDAVGIQRAFIGDAKAKLAAALDMKKAAFEAAREKRDAARTAAKAALDDCRDRVKAAADEAARDVVKAECKAATQKALDDAKAAIDAFKMNWSAQKMALIEKLKMFVATKKDNRKVIVIDIKNLVGSVADLKEAVKAASPEAEVEQTAGTKRAPGATVVASCAASDAECYMLINGAVAQSVGSVDDATITQTSADELNAPVLNNDEFGTGATTKGGATAKPMNNSAATLVLSAVVAVVALAAL